MQGLCSNSALLSPDFHWVCLLVSTVRQKGGGKGVKSIGGVRAGHVGLQSPQRPGPLQGKSRGLWAHSRGTGSGTSPRHTGQHHGRHEATPGAGHMKRGIIRESATPCAATPQTVGSSVAAG